MRRGRKGSADHPELGLPDVRPLWEFFGLFSDHYLKARIAQNAWWPKDDEVRSLWEFCRDLYNKRYIACAKNNEAFTRQELLNKILERLGFPWSDNLKLPESKQDLEPDYILYPDADTKERVLDKSTAERYRAAITLLEAKKVNHPLSQISRHQQRYPHQQLRQYLDEAQVLSWGILANGNEWRLYCRDAKPSQYFALNFEVAIRSLENFKYFAALFTPAAFARDAQGKCRLDQVRESAVAAQWELEEDLRQRVFTIVEILANGFAERAENNIPDTPEGHQLVYKSCLIFLYRLLFILYAEGRGLLPVAKKWRKYYKELSLARLVGQLQSFADYDSKTRTRLHEDIVELCHLINGTDERKNKEYDVPRYNGGLFDPEHYPHLERWRICDAMLADVLRDLMFAKKPDRSKRELPLQTVDYADLRVQQLGSIYEGLLEHHFVRKNGQLALETDKEKRKATGTYYTPDYIVKYIVENSIGPLVQQIEESEPVKAAKAAGERDNSFADAVLRLDILDPAMGSGHFLVEATVYLADQIIAHPTTQFLTSQKRGEPKEHEEIAYWRRRVVESCIYGVDLNPLAVELAKLSLWLTTISSDQPLNFLDHHLHCGNSLIGARLDDLGKLPDRKKKARRGAPRAAEQTTSTFGPDLKKVVSAAIAEIRFIEDKTSGDVDAVKDKEKRWLERVLPALAPYKAVADLWTSASFGNEIGEETYVAHARKMLNVTASGGRRREVGSVTRMASVIAAGRHFFHWELEFPEVFFNDDGTSRENPGFDAVVGNPPYGSKEMLDVESKVFIKGHHSCTDSSDTAEMFVEKAFNSLGKFGSFGFIVPKPLTYITSWHRIRHFLSSRTIHAVADVSKAFPGVLLEQVIVIASNQPCTSEPASIGEIAGGKIVSAGRAPAAALSERIFQIRDYGVSGQIKCKAERSCSKLGDHWRVWAGIGGITGSLIRQPTDNTTLILKGQSVNRYMLTDDVWYVPNDVPSPRDFQEHAHARVICQDIVAHITQPEPHIMLMATLAGQNALTHETVINFSPVSEEIPLSSSFLVALLNSSFVSWFAYKFIFNEAVRTMHFRPGYADFAPIPRIAFSTPLSERKRLALQGEKLYETGLAKSDAHAVLGFAEKHLAADRTDVVHDLLALLAERMTTLNKQKHAAARGFLTDLKDFHSVDAHRLKPKTKLDEFWTLEVTDLFEHLKANVRLLAAQGIRLKESDDNKIRSRFQKAKEKIIPLESTLAFTDRLIDQIVYRLYGLTEEEIRIVEGERQ